MTYCSLSPDLPLPGAAGRTWACYWPLKWLNECQHHRAGVRMHSDNDGHISSTYSGLMPMNCIISADALSKVLLSLELSFPICKEVGSAMATSKLLAQKDSPGAYIGRLMLAPVSALHPTPLPFPPLTSQPFPFSGSFPCSRLSLSYLVYLLHVIRTLVLGQYIAMGVIIIICLFSLSHSACADSFHMH